jgi:hypothetical protein
VEIQQVHLLDPSAHNCQGFHMLFLLCDPELGYILHIVILLPLPRDYLKAEDHSEPGVLLQQKFSRLIDSCSIFVALITEFAIRSKWVEWELSYAKSIGKTRLLLKEKSVPNIASLRDYEWIEFDSNWSQELLFDIVMQNLRKIQANQPSLNPSLVTVLGISLLSFLIGWYLRK